MSIVAIGFAYGLLNLAMRLDPRIFSRFFGTDYLFAFVQEQIARNMLFFYALFLAIPITMLFEAIIPANPKQKLWNHGVKQDLIWLFVSKIFKATVVVWYVGILSVFYDRHLSALTIESLSDMSAPVRFLIGILLADFSVWFHHVARHKVPWFWHFHAVHHSQKEMNLFTDFKIHVLEFLIAETLVFIPLFMLSFETPEVISYFLFLMFYTRFYHGNVRTNLGPLRYVLVTPQSHRIHHSSLEEHQDKNFGVIFCIWDRIFGTHVDDGTYPPTGIYDETFPHPRDNSVREIAVTFVKQLIYPFRKIYESCAK